MKIMIVLLLLVGCGGGDQEDERAQTSPPQCIERPELCR